MDPPGKVTQTISPEKYWDYGEERRREGERRGQREKRREEENMREQDAQEGEGQRGRERRAI